MLGGHCSRERGRKDGSLLEAQSASRASGLVRVEDLGQNTKREESKRKYDIKKKTSVGWPMEAGIRTMSVFRSEGSTHL